MDKYQPDMKRHCYFNDPRYPVAICYDYKHIDNGDGFCHRYKQDLKIEEIKR